MFPAPMIPMVVTVTISPSRSSSFQTVHRG
jgi:hypothetical protein